MVTKAYLPPMEEYVEKINEIWKTNCLTNMGPLHQRFEKELTNMLGVQYCLAFSNGHQALELLIQSMLQNKIIKVGCEVITTPFTFASTTHAIVRNGLVPVFADIKEDDYTLDPKSVEQCITDKTGLILPVHVYGYPCDTEAFQEISARYQIPVIYDGAHAFGVRYKNNDIGNYGFASIFSFHATKPFNSIEGGAIVFSDPQIGFRAYQMKNFGILDSDLVVAPGTNAKLSEFHAAMGLCNLDHWDEIKRGRKQVIERYRHRLEGVEGISFHVPNGDVEENYAYFPIVINEKVFGVNRDVVSQVLQDKNVFVRKYFYPLTCDFQCYRKQDYKKDIERAKYVSNRIVTLPVYADLSQKEIDFICDVIIACKRQALREVVL